MNCLGIESTAHTFSCAIIEKKRNKGKILSDVRRITNNKNFYMYFIGNSNNLNTDNECSR